MKTIFTVLMLMFFAFIGTVKAQINPVGVTPFVSLGGVTLPASQAIILHSSVTVSGRYNTFRKAGVLYQVPTGKKLVILAARSLCITAAACDFYLGYSSASVDNSTIPAGWTLMATSNGVGYTTLFVPATVGANAESLLNVEFSAGQYPGILAGNLPTVTLLGYLANP